MDYDCEKISKEDYQMNSQFKGSFNFAGKDIFYYKIAKAQDREKVLLIHGMSACCALYTPLIHALSEYYNVLCIDLPGHGYSSAFKEYSLSLFLDVLAEGCKVNNFDNFYVVGNSMGGQLAACCGSYEKFNQFSIKGIFISAPSGVAIYESFGVKLMRSGLLNLVPQYTLFNLIKKSSRNMQKALKGQYAKNMKIENEIFDEIINNTEKKCQFADRTRKQVKYFPWNSCQEYFILLDKSNIPVALILLQNDKIVNTPKLLNFLKDNCHRLTPEIIEDDHSFNTLKPKYYARIVHQKLQEMNK